MNKNFFVLITALMLSACAIKPIKTPIESGPLGVIKLNGESDSHSAGKLRSTHFAFDSSNLDKLSREILTSNADYMNANRLISVQIEGHCDERGSRQYNLALGDRRAIAVRNFLKDLGIRSQRMKLISLGNEKPLALGDDELTHTKNRRANFIILGK